jgi:uncharacterized membrane protein YbhN (UPF0104 family)
MARRTPAEMSKRLAIAVVPLLLGGGTLLWVLQSFDVRAFLSLVETLDWRWLALAVFFDVFSYVAQGYRWRELLKPIALLSVTLTTRAVYAGLFLNEMIPLRPGEVLRGWMIARESGQRFWRIVSSGSEPF